MPIKQNAAKALRQSKKRQKLNIARKDKVKLLKKKIDKAVTANNKEEAIKLLKDFYQALDKAVKKDTIKKNNASRKKSRVSKKINKLK